MRPVARWKLLWFGVLVMGFLGWAWLDSLRWISTVRYGEGTLRHADSGICLAVLGSKGRNLYWVRTSLGTSDTTRIEFRLDAPELLRVRGDSYQRDDYYLLDKDGGRIARNAAAAHFSEALDVPGAWAVYVPHWLVMVCFAIPWLGLLGWRWRRERRRCL